MIITTTTTTEELRRRMLAAMTGKKPQDFSTSLSKSEKLGLRGYNADSTSKNAVTSGPERNRVFTNKTNAVTALPAFSAYQCAATEPGGVTCSVSVIELPAAGRYRETFAFLQAKPPDLISVERWQQCVEDGKRFLAKWGEQAEALGWSSADLFGLHQPPERPHSSYNRLSRYDATGLCWLLQGRRVMALTAETAAIATGSLTTYRKHNKPALGPLGDSLEDLK